VEGSGRGLISGTVLGLTKTTEVYQDNWPPSRHFITAPYEYETGLLTFGWRLSLNRIIINL